MKEYYNLVVIVNFFFLNIRKLASERYVFLFAKQLLIVKLVCCEVYIGIKILFKENMVSEATAI